MTKTFCASRRCAKNTPGKCDYAYPVEADCLHIKTADLSPRCANFDLRKHKEEVDSDK